MNRPMPVKRKRPNRWGLYDVEGNAMESVPRRWYAFQHHAGRRGLATGGILRLLSRALSA